MATPAQISRAREGLREASGGSLDVDSMTDEQIIAKYMEVSDPQDPFRAELTGGAPAGDPGSIAADSGKAVRALDTWYQDFRKRNDGRHPTDEELTAAWGEYGMAARQYIDGIGGTPTNKEDVFKALGDLAVKTPPSGSVGMAYALPPDLATQKFDYQKDYDAKKMAADDAKAKADKAYQDAQIALSQGNQALAQQQFALSQQQFAYSKQQGDEANAIALAGLTGTYNGQPTIAMQQFEQNKAQFQQTFGLQYEQFQAQKEQWATENGFTEAQVTGMFKGNPTLAMQQFLQNKDQFAKNFGLSEAGVTGTYNGAPTEAARQFNISSQQTQDQIAYQAARAGNPLQYLQATRGIGAPLQNYHGLSIGQGVAPQNMAPGYNPGGVPGGGPTSNTQPVGGAMLAREQAIGQGQGGQIERSGGPYMQQAPGVVAQQGGVTGQQQSLEQQIAASRGQGGVRQSGPYMQQAAGDVQNTSIYGQQEPNIRNMAPGYQQPQMPGNISAVLSGTPLPAYGLGSQPQQGNNAPGNPYQLRAAGAQAQANEGFLGKQSRYEAYELAGVRGEDLAENESRIKKNLGGGLAPASYRGY